MARGTKPQPPFEVTKDQMLVSLGIAALWGEDSLMQGGSEEDFAINKVLISLGDELRDLAADYEIQGSLDTGAMAEQLEEQYTAKLNAILDKYRLRLFKRYMMYIGEPIAVDLMLSMFNKGKKESEQDEAGTVS